ncbi:helix-turn-helix domain-containing protein [bacterium RCC_150]
MRCTAIRGAKPQQNSAKCSSPWRTRRCPTFSRNILDRAVKASDAADQSVAADELREAFQHSGLSRAEFAHRMGTSQSRLSTYLSGKVTPSSVVLMRARRLGRPLAATELA